MLIQEQVRGFSQPVVVKTGSCDRPGPTLSPSSLPVHSLTVRVVFCSAMSACLIDDIPQGRCPRCRWGPEAFGSAAGVGLVCPASLGRPKTLRSNAGLFVAVPSGSGSALVGKFVCFAISSTVGRPACPWCKAIVCDYSGVCRQSSSW